MVFTTRYLSKYCFSSADVGPIGIMDVRHCVSISCINPPGWDGFQRLRTNSSLRHARQTKWNENQRAPFLGSAFCSSVSNATKALVSVSHRRRCAPLFSCYRTMQPINPSGTLNFFLFFGRPAYARGHFIVYAILIASYCLHLFLLLVVVLLCFLRFFLLPWASCVSRQHLPCIVRFKGLGLWQFSIHLHLTGRLRSELNPLVTPDWMLCFLTSYFRFFLCDCFSAGTFRSLNMTVVTACFNEATQKTVFKIFWLPCGW